MFRERAIEKIIALASFLVAAALAFVSMLISPGNDVQSNTLLAIAQFLTLTATILGIDYKFNSTSYERKHQQQHGEHSESEV